MTDAQPSTRLNYQGDLAAVINSICKDYGIGTALSHTVISTGYEDCNVIIQTDQAKYMAKMFAKTRKPEDIARYAEVMKQVVAAGVNHPKLFSAPDGQLIYTNSGISLVLMQFIEGKTFYELDRLPTATELQAILTQAARINQIGYRPPLLFDSWAIPNISLMLEKVKQYVDPADLELVLQAKQRYEAIPVDSLPQAFVHGDLIKTNLVKADTGEIYVLDFSVANWYPRIQELAVIAANLLHSVGGTTSLKERCDLVAKEYSQLNFIIDLEYQYLYDYALAGAAMEFLGSHQEKFINGNDSDETEYWFRLGREGLRQALA